MRILSMMLVISLFVGCSLTSMKDMKNTSDEQSNTPQPSTVVDTPEQSSLDTPNPTETPITIDKPYKMSKSYDIVPKVNGYDAKVVLLTFDDGPKTKEMNQAILNVLKKYDAKAIFFVNGYLIKRNPELVQFLVDNGQVIGNHSYDHIDLNKQEKAIVDYQIQEVQRMVKAITNEEPTFFRPPYGSKNDYIRQVVASSHMLFMNWSNGSLDWQMTVNQNDPSKIIENVLSQLRNGSNILMHELPWTVEALDQLLGAIQAKGYSFVDPHDIDTTIDPYAHSN